VARTQPFADLTDGPAPDAAVVEFGRPAPIALGCVGGTAFLVGLIGLASLIFAAFGWPGPAGASAALRAVGAVVGVLFLLLVLAVAAIEVRVLRHRQALAFDSRALWCQVDAGHVRLPWDELAAVRVVDPKVKERIRTSARRMPTVEVWPKLDGTITRYPALATAISYGDPLRPGTTGLRFAFRLDAVTDREAVLAAVRRFGPGQWTSRRQ
jgi:hypothetical protein